MNQIRIYTTCCRFKYTHSKDFLCNVGKFGLGLQIAPAPGLRILNLLYGNNPEEYVTANLLLTTIMDYMESTTYKESLWFNSDSELTIMKDSIVKMLNTPVYIKNMIENFYKTNVPLFMEDTENKIIQIDNEIRRKQRRRN
jgi:hypothetical protein